MDYRSASQSHGTSPLKAAGLLVGLLIVVALAFALGMKAGHELDLLRRDDGGEPARVAAHESRGAEPERGARAEPAAPQRGSDADRGAREAGAQPAATATSSAGPGKSGAAASVPTSGAIANDTTDATASARGEHAASRAPATHADVATPPTKPAPTPPVPSPAFDYGMFKSTGGANAGSSQKPAPATETARASTPAPAAEAPSKAAAPATAPAPRTDASKPPVEARDTKVALAKPPPPVTPKKPEVARAPAAAPATSPKLTIAPEAPAKATKPEAATAPGFVVQVAELDSKADADQLLTRLKAHGISAAAAKVDMPTGARYRIRVGRYTTMAEAKAAQKKVTAAGFAGSAIVSSR